MLSDVETGAKKHFSHDTYHLLGKKIVIVGDADGIGRATAAMMVERGAKVFIAVSSPAELTAAFAEIAQTGGEWDGMVVNLNIPGEVNRFFDQAERRLGRIDVFVSVLEAERWLVTREGFGPVHGQCLKEAVERMRSRRGGQVISIGAAGRAIPAVLRREASDLGIRMTLIDPSSLFQCELGLPLPGAAQVYPILERQEIARCVLNSVAHSYGPDVVFMKGIHQKKPL